MSFVTKPASLPSRSALMALQGLCSADEPPSHTRSPHVPVAPLAPRNAFGHNASAFIATVFRR